MEKQPKTHEKTVLQDHPHHNAEMGTGSCTRCDCKEFMPSTETGGGGNTCINHNSAGGTCNHTRNEHN